MQREKNFKAIFEYIQKRLYSERRFYKNIIIYGDIDDVAFEMLLSLIDSDSRVYEFSGRANAQRDQSSGNSNLVSSNIISLDRLKQEILDNPPELIVLGEFNWQLRDSLSYNIRKNKSDVLIIENCVANLRSFILSLIFMNCYSTKKPSDLVVNDEMPVFLSWD